MPEHEKFDLMLLDDFLALTGWKLDTLRQYRYREGVKLPTIVEIGKIKYMRRDDVQRWLRDEWENEEWQQGMERQLDRMATHPDEFSRFALDACAPLLAKRKKK